MKEFNFLITQIEEKRKKKRKKRNENLSTQQPKFTQGASTAQIYFILIGVVEGEARVGKMIRRH